MPTERERAISPIVQESVQHNTQVISNIRSLTASLFGVASGILGLESYSGFLFYLLGTFFVSVLIWSILAKGRQGDYFQGAWSELWAGDVLNGEIEFWGTLREEARRKGKDVTMGIISAGKGVGAAAEEDDSWSGKLETHVA
ncbi:MAG: hypothetical protein ALECFALPRED_007143 [Alectoria fallacina]|uniref:ER membrane protein complex subunit 6 n=1 Tax=Alectoria fallacina TaxID=1903189 RepID=A0A8H3GC55_9LECA|nr:MAG: hypothetical protein ALECFALPRED_007143 [Alectoria fallacina]